MRAKLHYVILITIFFTCSIGLGQTKFVKVNERAGVHGNQDVYQIDNVKLRNVLGQSPIENSEKRSNVVVDFPMVDGKVKSFKIVEASVMSPELQAQYPEIRSYMGYSLNDASVIRFSISPYNGLNGIVLGGDKVTIIESDRENMNRVYVSDKSSRTELSDFECKTIDTVESNINPSNMQRSANDGILRVYRLAMSVTGEYSAFHGGTLASVNAAINTTLTAVNAVYENDFNVRMVLVSNNNNVVYLNGATDPYSSTSDGSYSATLANTLDTVIGAANYDIGHLMGGIGNNGYAGCIGCVCNNGSVFAGTHKGSGYTTSTNPIGPTFDIDYVAHEIGHQFGANHTHSLGSEGAGIAQMEPGSGSTIMAYAGLGGAANVQQNSDPYFHAVSIFQVMNHVTTSALCSQNTNTGNITPTANAGNDLTLPIGTAFKLVGTGSDANGDAITFCWEQYDESDGNLTFPNPASTNSNTPLFRSYLPTTNPVRVFPKMEDLLDSGVNGTIWEKIPTVGRAADFRLTVRDNKPGGASNTYDDMRVTFSAAHGPFQVTSQNTTGIIWESGTTETITWNVNNTNTLAGSTNVNILLSTDGGLTYPITLASNVPNNGAYNITVPDTPAPYCRLLIEPTGNNYFAINSHNFSIDYEIVIECTQYSASPNVGITDNAQNITQVSQINVPETGTITDVNVGVNITHPYIGDLFIIVQSPDEDQVFLTYPFATCGSEDNLIVKFSDSGTNFNCAQSASNMVFKPYEALSGLNGGTLEGNWLLGVGDYGAGDVGTFNSWYVEVCETTLIPLSVDENVFTAFSIFPNPNNGEFTIKLNSSSSNKIKVAVYDVRGRLILENNYNKNSVEFNQTINLNNVQSGMYLVNVTDGNKQVTEKIVVH